MLGGTQESKEGMMSGDTQERERYKPLVLVDTKNLPRKEWLDWRRKGIGGSDLAAIMGVSPFRTARDVYYDKLNIVSADDEFDDNWVAKEMGTILEPLVARIFRKKTGYEIFQIKKMFHHPEYPFMLADVDYFVRLPDGSTAILEIKTTGEESVKEWWRDGEKTVPEYYEAQGRHYMCVTDIDSVFYCCLYGRSEDDVIIREIKRDFEYEAEMIFLEQYFWKEHVMTKIPPPYTEKGDLVMKSAKSHIGDADKEAPEVSLNESMSLKLDRYVKLQEEKKFYDSHSKKLESEMERIKGTLIMEMDTSCRAVCESNGRNYEVTYNPSQKMTIDKDNLLRLELQYPEIYKEFVRPSVSRRFYVKYKESSAA